MGKVMTEEALLRDVSTPDDLYKELLVLLLDKHLWPEQGLTWHEIIENSPGLEEEVLTAIVRSMDDGFIYEDGFGVLRLVGGAEQQVMDFVEVWYPDRGYVPPDGVTVLGLTPEFEQLIDQKGEAAAAQEAAVRLVYALEDEELKLS